ncbi:MBOAT, membrane-bound O-acyltransferase family-domain-containing protein [Lipomyces japonicus]|uniref:MBOAT, membrane-bound O-acyltransferase family-domain-containing protein n=1 Tax=Lipomyces japonicus TaxID=56871 RepID=UPI0034CF8357
MSEPVETTEETTRTLYGIPIDLLKLVLTLVLSYPFCGILKRLPDDKPIYKQIFCLSVSAFYLLGIFDLKDGLKTLLISSLTTYGLAKYVKNPLMPWIVFAFVMTHLTYSHVERYRNPLNAGNVDVTGAQMVLVMKLSAFAWNVHDGRQSQSELSPIQQDRALPRLPSLFDFLTYVFFFPSMLIGPSFDYAEFRRWLDLSMFENSNNNTTNVNQLKQKRKIPRSGRVATKKAIEGVAWIVLWLVLSTKFAPELLLSDWFVSKNIIFRIFYLWPLGFSYRLKYYGAWSLAEGSCILSGLSYNGKNPAGKNKWDRVRNIDPWRFETGQNTFTLLETWNMNTNKWLKTYVYLRVARKGRKPGFKSTLVTFLTSAFWHGISPGYYLTFVTGAFMQTCGKYSRRYIRPFFLTQDLSGPGPYKKYFDIATYISTQLIMGYAVQPFILLTFRDSVEAWKRVYFYGHVGLFTMVLVFSNKKIRKTVEAKLQARKQSLSKLDQIRFKAEHARAKRNPEELQKLAAEATAITGSSEKIKDYESPSLGIPQDDIELKNLKQEAEEDFLELKNDLEDFRRRRGLALDNTSSVRRSRRT